MKCNVCGKEVNCNLLSINSIDYYLCDKCYDEIEDLAYVISSYSDDIKELEDKLKKKRSRFIALKTKAEKKIKEMKDEYKDKTKII